VECLQQHFPRLRHRDHRPVRGSGKLNTDPTPGPNIIGGPTLGGNYYTKSDGTGFSDIARDVSPHDGFADQPYVFGPYAVDNYPLVVYRAYVNYPPVLAPIGDQTVLEGQTLTFILSATDANPGDILTFSAANLPPAPPSTPPPPPSPGHRGTTMREPTPGSSSR